MFLFLRLILDIGCVNILIMSHFDSVEMELHINFFQFVLLEVSLKATTKTELDDVVK